MLGKLLKYDLKWIYKMLIVFYILALVMAGVSRVCLNIEDSMLFDIIGKFTSGIAIGLGIGCLIQCVIRSWVRFIKNIYKDESYLTHTLPVEKRTIFLSKVIASIIGALFTVIMLVVILFICFGTQNNIEFLKETMELAADVYDTTIIKLLFVVSSVFLLEVICAILARISRNHNWI